MDLKLRKRDVRWKVPQGVNHVYIASSSEPSTMSHVVEQLGFGYIVVPQHSSKEGVEYLLPFVDARSGKLLVACVQCQFMKKAVDWCSMKFPLQEATCYFKTHGIEFFHVVYTTADQLATAKKTFGEGVYLVEDDIFRFTSRLGILRLHYTLEEVLKAKYPFLGK